MYIPPVEYLTKYADLLVNFALGGGGGIKSGDIVLIQLPVSARPFLSHLYEKVLQAGGHPLVDLRDDELSRTFFEHANEDQTARVPQNILDARVSTIDHALRIISYEDKKSLENVNPGLLMLREQQFESYKKNLIEKENNGNFTWTVGLYATPSMAEHVGLTLQEYRDQIIKACYLDYDKPISRRNEIYTELDLILAHLNSLSILHLEIKGQDIDLKIGLGKHRKRLAGSGRNMPSFEVFISPDWRQTEGRIKINQPLYRYGKMITGIELKFSAGIVVDSRATQGEDLLNEMLAVPGANKLGEFSLTDTRMSRITKFMGETLYDENVGGEYGNTHVAIGNSFRQSYPGNIETVTEDQRGDRGYNESVIHTDLVSTADRTVIATLIDGSQEIIYQNGQFSFFGPIDVE